MLLRRRLRRGGLPTAAASAATAALAVVTLLVTVSAGPAATAAVRGRHPGASAHAAKSHPGWEKYYIVQPAKNGHKEFLYEIAANTLGNGNRAAEIFRLNKGRLQPGGGRMEQEGVILPGWILVLPTSARGTGVRYGPLPAVTSSPSAPPSSAPPSTAPPSASASPAPSAGSSATARTLTLGASSSSRLRQERTDAAAAGGLLLLAILLSSAALIMRRRRRKPAAGPLSPAPGPGGTALPGEPEIAHSQAALDGRAVHGRTAVRELTGPDRPAEHGFPAWLDSQIPALDLPALGRPSPAPPATGTTPAPDVPQTPDRPRSPDAAGELPWPDFLTGGGQRLAGTGSNGAVSEMDAGRNDIVPEITAPADELPGNIAGRADMLTFSAVALRILGAQRPVAYQAETAGVATQRHEVASGGDRIQVVLTEAPDVRNDDRPRTVRTWLASDPYLVWTPLPYDAPDNGVAFACLGTGDNGCLFLDLAAAPGAITITGDAASAGRLAESIAHQLCAASAAGRPCIVVAIGAALPQPPPPGAAWVPSLSDLGSSVPPPGPADGTEMVFCQLLSNDDAFALARYTSSARRRIVPVILADLPGAPWEFTARPGYSSRAGHG
jgi:hypothetical protein